MKKYFILTIIAFVSGCSLTLYEDKDFSIKYKQPIPLELSNAIICVYSPKAPNC